MKNKKRVALSTFLTFLFFLCAMFSLSSCSRKSGNTMANVKMEGQSGNWKVVVAAIKKTTTQPPALDPTQIPGKEYDVLEVTLDIEYRGPSAEVPSPLPTLVDDKGKTFKRVLVSIRLPNGSEIKGMDSPKAKELYAVMAWLSPISNDVPKPRMVKTGEKFSATISFEDPTQYTNLKLTFGDVPPIPLKVPQDEKGKEGSQLKSTLE